MKLRDACVHGRWDAHGIRPAKGSKNPTRCPGGREVTINYEAAADALIERWPDMRPTTRPHWVEWSTAIVDAALGVTE